VSSADELRIQLDTIRRTGVAKEYEEVAPGLCCIAAPVFGPSRRPVAALSISTPCSHQNQSAYERTLREIAAAANRQLSRSRIGADLAAEASA
jgi:DNA-binding IclR family transcriptional regulator